ncbi:MAG: OmpH family outer membrane protein [Bacteroidota bacterium]
MKHLNKIILLLAVVMIAGTASAQTDAKLGYVNSGELLEKIPGRDTLEQKLKDYRKGLEDQVQSMIVEYRSKLQNYQENMDSMSDLIRQSKESELQELEQRIQNFRQTADEDLQNKQSELFNPLLEKAQKAIEKVAEEQGYTYVFDVSMGTLLYYEKGDNLQKDVEKELGIN